MPYFISGIFVGINDLFRTLVGGGMERPTRLRIVGGSVVVWRHEETINKDHKEYNQSLTSSRSVTMSVML